MRPKKVLQQLQIIATPSVATCNEITKERKSKIKQIIHISDIHIRHGDIEHSRYEEYRHVFTNFVAEIACLECVLNHEVLFVITGNIFHGKGKLDTPAIKLYFELMDRLLSFGSVIMICGNHEYRKDDLAHPDMLETMIIPYNKLHSQSQNEHQNKLVYLKDTGYYVIEHIGFGVKSITSNANEMFPTPDASNVDAKIALYHGSIDTSVQWFDEYDYVLLGNNSYQFVDNTSHKYISGYPGTFIQQEYVDSYLQHGFLQWTVSAKNIMPKAINIENDYSMIILKNTKLCQVKIVYNINGRKNVADFNISQCPKQPRIKAIGFNTNNAMELTKLFDDNNIKPVFITYANNLLNDDTNSIDLNIGTENDVNANADNAINANNTLTLTQLNCPDKWLEYIKDVCEEDKYDFITKLMNNPDLLIIPTNDMISDDIKERINNRNKRINDALSDYTKYNVSTDNTSTDNTHGINNINFKVLQWNYIMCYGEANYFDFDCMSGKFALLNGRNEMGKSAFLDVLCIALYGEPSKHRNIMYGKQNNGNIINNNCPSNKNMDVRLRFKVNETEYEIYREYTYTKPEIKQGLKHVHANITNITENIVCCNTLSEINAWIISMFGTIDDLLMSSFITQIETNNFFNLKQEEQKQVLDSALHLESISRYSKIIKESALAYHDIINHVKSTIDIINNMKGTQDLNKTKKEISFINDMINNKVNIIKESRDAYNAILGRAGNIEDFKTLIEFLKENDITASKRHAKLKRKLETNEFKSITEQDRLYYKQIMNRDDNVTDTGCTRDNINTTKYKELKLQINESTHIIATLDFGTDIEIEQHISKLELTYESVLNILAKLEKTKPELHLSDTLFTKKQKQVDAWNAVQNEDETHSEWLENPDCLDSLHSDKSAELEDIKTQYDYLVKHPIIKPQLENIPTKPTHSIDGYNLDNIDSDLFNKLDKTLKQYQSELTELYKNKVTSVKTEAEYNKWLKTYTDWTNKFQDFINEDNEENDTVETVESIDAEIQQTILYRDSIIKKLHEKETYERELMQLDIEIQNFANIPYNDTCWACKQQPMRIRHNQINDTKTQVLRNVSKINKYLEKISTDDFANLITELNTKIEELHKDLALRKEYEYTVEIKTSEYESWQDIKASWKQEKKWNQQVSKLEKEAESIKSYYDYVQYILWKTWKNDMKTLNTKITELTEEIKDIDDFIKSYEQINETISELDRETELRDKYKIWNDSYILNTKYKTYFETINKIKELRTELNDINNSQQLNTDLIEKVKEYNKIDHECILLERYIIYEHANKTLDTINVEETQLNNLREKLTLLKKEESDTIKYNEKVESYTSYYDALINTRTYITILDELFIGTNKSGSENDNSGYKEWVYKTHVIPLIQSHINSFLGLIDNISLEIIYTNKTFQYVVHDRNNTPNLSMTSGYQRFIIGLALRIAFAKIGAVGQNIKHLFIDEGFVACDIYNLDKVNMILKAIHTYGGYDSIMLMSHLDSIRSAADVCINIQRVSGQNCGIGLEYSHICFSNAEDIPVINNTKVDEIANVSYVVPLIEKEPEPVKKPRKRTVVKKEK